MLDSIRKHFQFLEDLYGFIIVKEESKFVHFSNPMCYIVHYKNEFVYMEIGAYTNDAIELEIRRYVNGELSSYGDDTNHVNLKVFQALLFDEAVEKNKIFSLDLLSNSIKEHIQHFITDNWYEVEKIKSIKTKLFWKNDIIEEVIHCNKELLRIKGFRFFKSNNTLSSFDSTEYEGPFYEYKNGDKILRIEFVIDVREQCFYFHIQLTGKEIETVFNSNNAVNHINQLLHNLLE